MTHPDVIIIGAGAGGAATAWRLVQQGLNVLIVEAGPRYEPARDYKLHTARWELERFPFKPAAQGQHSFDVNVPLAPQWDALHSWNAVVGRLNRSGERIVADAGYHHVRGVGGSTLHYSGESHRLHPQSMQLRKQFGVGADWPLSYADLEPYYQIAEKLVGVAGSADAGARWRSEPYPLPAHPLCKASRCISDAARSLGMHWQANSRAALSQPYDNRPACNYCGNCSYGCPIGDKGSADVTFIRHALASGHCTIMSDTQVTRLVSNSAGRITGIEITNSKKSISVLEAPIVVLAGGAVETPRLLLNSATKAFSKGLANGNGQVGRNFMDSLTWVSTGMVDTSLDSFKGLPADAICWDYNAPDSIPDVVGGCRLTSATQEIGLTGSINYARRIVPGFGAKFKQDMRASLGHALSVSGFGEMLPNEDTRIDLDPSQRDALGLPLARIRSRLTEADFKRLRFMADKCRGILKAAGTKTLVEEFSTYDYFSAAHVFGSCRMGDNSQDSVVNAFGRAHECENLYITDASIFPSTGGGEAPSLTIFALALRTADHIAGEAVRLKQA
ncbi:MAG: hypothetical protein A3I83_02550 [Methylotenera sp. RIFCSPLOWO2_02_FULL_45_14]|nr:MAG: hypothetical protein A3I83_02550 [Methylotenera sp. RIFCSPLOWO2_02_FULL_45_14]